MKRDKNKKIVLASTIVLGIAAITSSALAAYIITGGNDNYSGDITPSPIEIDNNVIYLSASIEENLIFYPEQTVSGEIVTTKTTGNLSVNLHLEIEGAKETIDEKTFNVTVTETSGTLVTDGYVVLPTAKEVNGTEFSYKQNEENKSLYYKDVELTWTWGSKFGKKDPATFYNGQGDASEAVKGLTAFKTAVGTSKFTVAVNSAE